MRTQAGRCRDGERDRRNGRRWRWRWARSLFHRKNGSAVPRRAAVAQRPSAAWKHANGGPTPTDSDRVRSGLGVGPMCASRAAATPRRRRKGGKSAESTVSRKRWWRAVSWRCCAGGTGKQASAQTRRRAGRQAGKRAGTPSGRRAARGAALRVVVQGGQRHDTRATRPARRHAAAARRRRGL